MKLPVEIIYESSEFTQQRKQASATLAELPPTTQEAAAIASSPLFRAQALAQIAQQHHGIAQLIHALSQAERLMAEVTALTMLGEESVRAKVYKWIGREPLQIHADDLAGLVANCDSYLREAAIFIGAIAYIRDYYAQFGRFPKKREIRPLKGVG